MSNYVLVVWTNMSDQPYTVERADNFERYEVMSIEKYQDLVNDDLWYCWEEHEYYESGRYEEMLTDNQLKGIK